MKKNKVNNLNSDNYNLFAILALVFTFIFYPVGLILGFIALSQIKKSKEKGKWIALIPIWVGLFLVAFILYIFIRVFIIGMWSF